MKFVESLVTRKCPAGFGKEASATYQVSVTLVHSLIEGERKGSLYGSVATVLLAVVFTIFQGIEYSVSSFTISDGAFGACFFFGTGFHGLICSPNNFLYNKLNNKYYSNLVSNTNINNKLNITMPTFTSEVNSYYLDRKFIE